MLRKILLGMLIATTGYVAIDHTAKAGGPFNPGPLNNSSDLPDVPSAPGNVKPQGPLLPPLGVKLQFRYFRPDINAMVYWTEIDYSRWILTASSIQPWNGQQWIQIMRNQSEVMLLNPNTNEKVLLTKDGSMFSSFNPPPGRSWRLFVINANFIRLN